MESIELEEAAVEAPFVDGMVEVDGIDMPSILSIGWVVGSADAVAKLSIAANTSAAAPRKLMRAIAESLIPFSS